MPLKILLTCIESKKKITFKQKYDFLAKGIYRPWMYGYIQNFQKAIFNSKRLGVDVSHEHIEFKRVEFGEKEKQELEKQILSQLYSVEKLELTDIAQKCTYISMGLKKYLKRQFNINTYVTIGNVYVGGQICYREKFITLKKRFVDRTHEEFFKFHAWLTLEDMSVLDITIFPNVCAKDCERGNKDHERILWLTKDDMKENKQIIYEPKLVGEDYLQKIRTPIGVFLI